MLDFMYSRIDGGFILTLLACIISDWLLILARNSKLSYDHNNLYSHNKKARHCKIPKAITVIHHNHISFLCSFMEPSGSEKYLIFALI